MELRQKLETGEFAVLAEMEPPKGTDVDTMRSNARRVKGKVDAFIVPEMSSAVMRMSSLGGALVLRDEGLECMIQVCCRDRNRLAIQGDLLAAWALGIHSVMAVAGEDPSVGDHHQARAVNDIELLELLQAIDGLKNSRDMAGVELSGGTDFLAGTTAGFGARGKSPELEVEEMMRRAAAGARFFVTPPLFDLEIIRPFMRRIEGSPVMVLPTVLLLKSLGMARYIARNMPHIHIPDPLIDRIQRAPDKVRECVRIASETVARLRDEGFGGVVISTIGWEHKLPEVLEGV
jgi:5,10-methylenetetrahydrofolate reductase